jgi:hypothetical protein
MGYHKNTNVAFTDSKIKRLVDSFETMRILAQLHLYPVEINVQNNHKSSTILAI